jgi:hypothetical protein
MIRRVALALLLAGPGAHAQTAGLDCARISPAERTTYTQALQRGGTANMARHYDDALVAYQQAAALQIKACGRTDPSQTFALSHVALQQSNLGRFAEAEQTFARVDVLLPSVDPMVRGRALHNRALNAANQKHWSDALALADKAEDAYLSAAPALRSLADTPPPRPISYDRPQRLLEPQNRHSEGKTRPAAAALHALYASEAFWAKNMGDRQRATLYQRRSHALAVTIDNGL